MMAGAALPQKKSCGNVKHNELFASQMMCDRGDCTARGNPNLPSQAQWWLQHCQHCQL